VKSMASEGSEEKMNMNISGSYQSVMKDVRGRCESSGRGSHSEGEAMRGKMDIPLSYPLANLSTNRNSVTMIWKPKSSCVLLCQGKKWLNNVEEIRNELLIEVAEVHE